MNCMEKVCHESLSSAWKIADTINHSRVLVFAPMNSYWCDYHSAYHTGHARKLPDHMANVLVAASEKRVALRDECAELSAAAECLALLAA